MSHFLEKHFEESTNQSNLKLLESQWRFDQKLIPKALQSVGQFFPHYSRHDQSHSDQILINIERLLGENRVKLLSATDTWLLLEAAYWHDIGMVVPHKALTDALENPEFQAYRRQIATDSSHELQNFALNFDGPDISRAFAGADNPLDAVEKFRLLMAEWFRRQHPKRSEKSVNDPWEELGLSSPRTELIPKRLFRLLGNICALHGATFTDVLDKLPHKEVGMANDDCHPRFIACLLRLGDLLDLDDNRFCPVMQGISGDKRPALSKAHEDKHNSIRNFRLNPDRIEISAVCDSIDGYVEQWRWLDCLRDEMQCQMARWLDIAPSPELGLLPTLGTIKVDIAGRQLITKPGTRPEFSLNSTRVMTLLKGENLYHREDVVRELLQNSVDATLLRVWLSAQSEEKVIGNEPNEVSKEYFSKFPIKVCLERIENPELPVSTEQIKWQFTIVDKGIGISQADLPYLMNIAGSSTNVKRQAVIEAMPEWMQPSGTFGIGLQSVFMWTDVVKIQTKCFYTHEALDITLHSPTGPQHGLVTVEREVNAYLRSMGTKLIFDMVTDSKPFVYSIAAEQNLTSQAQYCYDRLLDKDLPIIAWKAIDAVNNFSKHSPIGVEWEFKNFDDQVLFSENISECQEDQIDFFSETNSKFRVTLGKNIPGNKTTLRYRGQVVNESNLLSYIYFAYELDLYAGKAGDWLTFNRNGLTTEGKEKIKLIVARNLKLWVEKNKEKLLTENKAEISILAKGWAESPEIKDDQIFWQSLANEVPDAWKDLLCQVKEHGNVVEKSYRHILQKDLVIINHSHPATTKLDPEVDNLAFIDAFDTIFCIRSWCEDYNHGIRYITRNVTEHTFTRKQLLPQFIEVTEGVKRLEVDETTLAFAIDTATCQLEGNRRLLVPLMLFPEHLKMERLVLQKAIRLSGVQFILEYNIEPMPHILLPYEIRTNSRGRNSISLDRFDEFVKWVTEHLENPLTLQETKMACTDLLKYIDVIMKDSTRWEKLQNPNMQE